MKLRAALLALVVLGTSPARAQDMALESWTEVDAFVPSPEHFGFELRIGSYTPLGLGDSFSDFFGGDLGPMLALELHYFPVRIQWLGMIGGGVGIGWCQWEGTANEVGATAGESNTFEVIPINLMLVWRWDTLAREIDLPIVITPKIGLDVVYYSTGTGGVTDDSGWSLGPRFAGKVSLELDFLEPRAARQLDEEWGVNHSELFFEAYYSMTDFVGLPVSGWGWTLGLGLTF
jgi:hypothetical protein